MNTRRRWDELSISISTAALSVVPSSRTYPEGVIYFISRRLPSGVRIEIHDKWWRKNHDVWVGYQVHVEDAEGIVIRDWPITKKRSEVIAAVRGAMQAVTA